MLLVPCYGKNIAEVMATCKKGDYSFDRTITIKDVCVTYKGNNATPVAKVFLINGMSITAEGNVFLYYSDGDYVGRGNFMRVPNCPTVRQLLDITSENQMRAFLGVAFGTSGKSLEWGFFSIDADKLSFMLISVTFGDKGEIKSLLAQTAIRPAESLDVLPRACRH